jgi:UDPglucose 6-dehydrogenase
LKPGLGISGGNLERDLATVLSIGENTHSDVGVVSAWVANSNHRKDWTWRTLYKTVLAYQPEAEIALLGLAYKEDTNSTKNSPALALLSHLDPHTVTVYDPVVSFITERPNHKVAKSAAEAINGVDVVCILTPWSEFKSLIPAKMIQAMRGRWLIDPFCVIDIDEARIAGLVHIRLGVSPSAT